MELISDYIPRVGSWHRGSSVERVEVLSLIGLWRLVAESTLGVGRNTAPVILAPICYRNGGCILLKHLLLRITIIDFYCSSYNYDNGGENTTVMLTNIHSIYNQ